MSMQQAPREHLQVPDLWLICGLIFPAKFQSYHKWLHFHYCKRVLGICYFWPILVLSPWWLVVYICTSKPSNLTVFLPWNIFWIEVFQMYMTVMMMPWALLTWKGHKVVFNLLRLSCLVEDDVRKWKLLLSKCCMGNWEIYLSIVALKSRSRHFYVNNVGLEHELLLNTMTLC